MNLAERTVQLKAWNRAQNRDKLALWRFGVPRLRDAFRLFTSDDPINELHGRKPNRSGGTYTLAAFGCACLQKRPTLDGVAIPQWKGRIEAVQFVLDYKRQLLSVQPAYERLLAGWPYKARYQGAALSDLRIKPLDGSDDESTWSVIHFLSEDNPRAGVGIRSDLVLFDEPPVIGILQEMRKAAHAGRRSIRVIMETPEHMREWAPLLADYGDCPRSSIRRADWWRAEVRWSIDEVEDWVLSPAEKRELHDMYWTRDGKKRDRIAEARWFGDYTNAEGSTAWAEEGFATLMEMLALCTNPEEEPWRVSMESVDGSPNTVTQVPVEVFRRPIAGKSYYLDIDPSSGAEGRHEAALMLVEQDSGDLCVTWNGHLAPYSVGILAGGLARKYSEADRLPATVRDLGNCGIDIEMRDHWGVNVVRGVNACRMGHRLLHEVRELRRDVWSKEAGFDQNDETKSIIVGCIQEWLAAWRAGIKYANCPSRKVLGVIMQAELDDREKVIAGAGLEHGHFMILWGQALRRAVRRSNREIPTSDEPLKTPNEVLAAMIRGETTSRAQYRDGVMPKPIRRKSRV